MQHRFSREDIKEMIQEKLQRSFGRDETTATKKQMYKAACNVLRDIMADIWMENHSEDNPHGEKEVIYLSMEFLPGTSLRNNLFNLRLEDEFAVALEDLGCNIKELEAMEPDAGLGNGGLGRLASCYLDAIASLGMSGHGMSIRYEYGIFKQRIKDGCQEELPDEWLTLGDVWLLRKTDEAEDVHFGGLLEESWDEGGHIHVTHKDYTTVVAIPSDMLITGYDSTVVNTLRLWESTSPITIDMKLFAQGKYLQSMEEKHMAEVISKILYPEDAHREGKLLRLKQQYFFISASMQYLVKKHMRQYGTLDNFQDKLAIHVNDTHPTLAIPELVRIFVDDYGMPWDDAWIKVQASLSYTNHTVMPEALERWPIQLFKETLPRIYSIVEEINRRQGINLMHQYPGDAAARDAMAIIGGDTVRMANLCVEASHTVNGVSALHSDIIKNQLFRGFSEATPDKFTNVTNGIAYRRWLCQANPGLTAFLEELIGPGFKKEQAKLEGLLAYKDDSSVGEALADIKRQNKAALSKYVLEHNGVTLNEDSIFDVQVKRLHEYKRQLLNLFHILNLYMELKDDPGKAMVPRTFFFAAKSAAGYYMAKEIIKLANSISAMLEKDPAVRDMLRVVFLENYSVSLSEIIMPGAEVSEQISLAGKEASGTGNMKLMVNGALTIGTMDGANVEIYNQVGEENMFLFGMSAKEAEALAAGGSYDPWSVLSSDHSLAGIIKLLSQGIAGQRFPDIINSLTTGKNGAADQYFVLKDFRSYKSAQEIVSATYTDKAMWNRMSLVNIAKSGLFSADRAVQEYADRIWHIEPIKNRGGHA